MKKIFLNFIIPILLLLTVSLTPIYKTNIDVSTTITVVSLLFAILVGFFIANASQNYLRLQSLISSEDGSLISLFNLCKLIDKKSLDKVTDSIDNYVISTFDFNLENYIEKTNQEFQQVVNSIDEIGLKDKMDSIIMQYLHQKKTDLFTIRQEISLVSKRIMTTKHWIVVILLSVITGTLSLMLRDGSIFANIIISFLIISIYFVLLLVHEIDSNSFLEHILAFENSQRVFLSIGKMRYYPKYAIQNKIIKSPKESYRTGTIINGQRKIEVVEIK